MLIALAALPILALCFSPSDIDLFKLRKTVAEDLGEGTTFYSWLGVKNNAKNADIVKAYRKLSRQIHPDRNPGVEANERFARLNRVYKILRSPVREQYDQYLRSGFPNYDEATEEWSYRRFRPSLLLALILLALLYTAVEFLVLKVSAARQRQRIEAIINEARDVAKADSRTPGVITSVTEVALGRNTLSVHPNGDVFFQREKLTTAGVEDPTWKSTAIGRLVAKFQGAAAEGTTSAPATPAADVVESPEKATAAEPVEDAKKAEKTETETLKKGAARRRPAGARGKAKVF